MSRKELVTKVIDGDTFETAGRTRPVRLANVDAPEIDQSGGRVAKRALESLIGDNIVAIETVSSDVYGRAVAEVRIGSRSVNKMMNNKLNKMKNAK